MDGGIDGHIGAAGLEAMGVERHHHLHVGQHPRPGEHLPSSGQAKGRAADGGVPGEADAQAQGAANGIFLAAEAGDGGDAQVGGVVGVEEVAAAGGEGAKGATKHVFPHVAVFTEALGLNAVVVVALIAVKGLLGAVVEAGNVRGEQLDRGGMGHLPEAMGGGVVGAEAFFLALAGHVVVVEHGDVHPAGLDVVGELGIQPEAAEEGPWIEGALGRARQEDGELLMSSTAVRARSSKLLKRER